jgi:cysteine-rich repeat protein
LSSSSSSSSVSSSSVSSFAARCGDSIITAPEKCDDGNARGGDGCSAFCQIENGWQCTPRLP